MFLQLREFKISNFRKINYYEAKLNGNWISIVGTNSSGKSSIINALTFLSDFEAPNPFDIRNDSDSSYYEFDEVEASFSVNLLLSIEGSYREMMNNSSFRKTIFEIYKIERNGIISNNEKKETPAKLEINPSLNRVTRILEKIEEKTQLYSILEEGYIQASNDEFNKHPDFEPYSTLFDNNCIKSFDELSESIKFIEIFYQITVSDEPLLRIRFLDKERKMIINDRIFYHLIKGCEAFDHPMTFIYGFILTFFKGVINTLVYENHEESDEKLRHLLLRKGENLLDKLRHDLIYCPEKTETIKANFEKIFGTTLDFKLVRFDGSSTIQARIGNTDHTIINYLADGMKRVLNILVQLEDCDGGILFIDEVELHLHPRACKVLREILSQNKSTAQIITTTHSPIFIDPSYIDYIVLNQLESGKVRSSILDSDEISEALSAIGSSGVDVLFFELVIRVEGPSDVIYLEKFLSIFLEQTPYSRLINKIGIFQYGGKSVLIHMDLKKSKKLNSKTIFVLDGDNPGNKTDFDRRDRDFLKKCNEVGIFCWITKRREIENYLTAEILEKSFSLEPNSLEISEYDDVFLKLPRNLGLIKSKGEKMKTKLAKKVRDYITLDSLKTNVEIFNELSDFIKNVIQLAEK